MELKPTKKKSTIINKTTKKEMVNKKRTINKKGIYYTIDALLAGMLLIGAVFLVINTQFHESQFQQKVYLSQDLLNTLSELKLYELSDAQVQTKIANKELEGNNSILEQMGNYWATESPQEAIDLYKLAFNDSLVGNKTVSILFDSDLIYNNSEPKTQDTSAGKRMIAGITKGGPLTGYSSSAYLKKIRNKKTSSYIYFGGFIGQGNTTYTLNDFPTDFTTDKVVLMYLEGEFASNFSLYINGEQCESTGNNGEFDISYSDENVSKWVITHCNSSLKIGAQENIFNFNYSTPINTSYIAGGFLKIQYRTDELQDTLNTGTKSYYFPQVEGVANIYDSFYIPGNLNSMEITLHFKSEEQTYLTIGDRIIEINATGNDQTEIFTDEMLQNGFFDDNSRWIILDYDDYDKNTVPLRFASYNVSFEIVNASDADVVLITDMSGSMKKSIFDWTNGRTVNDCVDVFNAHDVRRTDAAQCVDYEFVDNILKYQGNRIWPVIIKKNEIIFYNNPQDAEAIKSYIKNQAQGDGKTCLSCAINQAYDILDTYSNSSRKKFIVLMTDGTPTHCADGSCTSTSVEFGNQYCEGLCDTNGACDLTNIPNQCLECTNNIGPTYNLWNSSLRAKDDLNVTIFTVGFGPMDDCPLCEDALNTTAIIGNGSYQHSNNITEIRLIYDNISREIISRVTQSAQTVVHKDSLASSIIYGDSKIEFTYSPQFAIESQGKISVTFEEELSTCTSTINVPSGIEIIDAAVSSYSGIHWSDKVITNSQTSFDLSNYYVPYYRLGDPFIIQIPLNQLNLNSNTFFIETGDSPTNRTGCSPHNKFIYQGLVSSVTARTDVKEHNEGCSWNVSFEDGDTAIINVTAQGKIPTKNCSYTPENHTLSLGAYDSQDTYDVTVYSLFSQLDMDNDGRVLINIKNLDLEIDATTISDIPYLWGPSIATIEIGSH